MTPCDGEGRENARRPLRVRASPAVTGGGHPRSRRFARLATRAAPTQIHVLTRIVMRRGIRTTFGIIRQARQQAGDLENAF